MDLDFYGYSIDGGMTERQFMIKISRQGGISTVKSHRRMNSIMRIERA
jgi:hypothetical protein